jgi:hypothetical protein
MISNKTAAALSSPAIFDEKFAADATAASGAAWMQ